MPETTRNGKMKIQGIIFDYGNVLCHRQLPSDMESMARVCGIPVARFRELYWKFRVSYDHGDLDGGAYWSSLASEEGRELSPENISQLIALDTAGWGRENRDVLRWVERLHKAGFPLALLSNMPSELSRNLRAQWRWARFIDHCVFSCDVRCNKPDPLIYRTCLDALRLLPEQVLFLDDIPVNVEAAVGLGIHGVVFDTLEQTAIRLAQRFDIPLPELGRPLPSS